MRVMSSSLYEATRNRPWLSMVPMLNTSTRWPVTAFCGSTLQGKYFWTV